MSAPHIPYSQPVYRSRRAARRPNPWLVRIPLLAFFGLILLALVLVILLAGYQFAYRDQILPGVSTVFDVNLAGMTRDEAIVALQQRFAYDDEARFTFRYGDQEWTMTAGELGVSFDAVETVNAAYAVGRGGGWLANLVDQLDAWTNGYPISPVITFNQTAAQNRLLEIAQNYVNRPVMDATLTIRDGRAVTTSSQVGRSVDISATLGVLRNEIMRLSTGSTINLIISETAPVVWDTTEVAARIDQALAAPVEFVMAASGEGGEARTWELPVETLEKMLVLEKVTQPDGSVEHELRVNTDEARALLEEIAPDVEVEPQNARFIFNDDTRQLEVIKNSVDGVVLDVEGTLAAFESAVFASEPDDRRVELVFQHIRPDIPDTATAAELGITENIVAHTTYYAGSSAARRRNVEVATANFHGLVIPPGGVFSFNEWLGDVSVETGYEQGLIIVGNQTITGVGGGVCQVSTTAFQAAFYAGFPILERTEHAYRVSYYETGEGPGLDATVYSPIVDFKFRNDTPYHLLIETYVNPNNASLTWKFYSTSMGRRVVKEGPRITAQTPPPPPIYRANPELRPGQIRQVDWAVSGADVYVWRTVYEGDRIIIDREEFVSHYVPWANQFEVAPGDPRINS